MKVYSTTQYNTEKDKYENIEVVSIEEVKKVLEEIKSRLDDFEFDVNQNSFISDYINSEIKKINIKQV